MLPQLFTDEELRSVALPTLLLIGGEERLYDPVHAIERARRLLPNVDAELITEAGHELPASKPATLDSRVLEFLEHTP